MMQKNPATLNNEDLLVIYVAESVMISIIKSAFFGGNIIFFTVVRQFSVEINWKFF